MKEKGWAGYPVIAIEHGGKKYLLDGHHRAYAARKASILVQYVLIQADSLPKFGYESIDQVVYAHAEAGPNRIRLF